MWWSVQKVWEGSCWEGMWLVLDPLDVVGLRTTGSIWNVPKKCGPHGQLLFFFKPVVLREMVDVGLSQCR